MRDLGLWVLLAPIVALQVLWVVARVPRLPEAAGDRAGQTGQGPALRVLVAGDSASVGVGIADQQDALGGHLARTLGKRFTATWRVIGANGNTVAGLLAQLRQEDPAPFDLVVLSVGVNDMKNGVPLKRFLTNYAALIALLRRRFGVRQIVISGQPPVWRLPLLPQPTRWLLGRRAKRFDAAMAQLADDEGVLFLPLDFPVSTELMAPDGLHPGPKICAIWAEEVARLLDDAD